MKRAIFFLLLALSAFALACGTAQASNRASLPVSQNGTDSLIVVKGVIKDAEDGEPVIGALIHVLGTDPDRRTDGVDCAVTHLDGEFKLPVAPGAMLVTECLGYLPDTSKVEPNMAIKLKVDPASLDYGIPIVNYSYVASGVVMDAKDRTLLPDATVFIRENVSKRTITDEKGKFRLVYPPDDGAMLEIELPGYLPYTCKAAPNLIVLLIPDPKAPAKVVKEKPAPSKKQGKTNSRNVVKGVVMEAESREPILGALIHVLGTDPDRRTDGVDCAVTHLDGEFKLRVAPGSMLVTECLGYLPDTTKAAPNMTVILKWDPELLEEVTAGPCYARAPTQKKTDSLIVVKGVIKDAEDGEPVIGANIYVRGNESDKRIPGVNQTNLDGEFELRAAPGTMLVTECIGYLSDTSKVEPNMVVKLKVDPESIEEFIPIMGQFSYVASGVVMDAEDRTLLPDAEVRIRENVSKRAITRAKTDEKGKFRLVYPPEKGAMLEIELPGYLPYTCEATINLIILLEPDPKAPEKVREAKSRHLAKQDKKTSRTTVKGVVMEAESREPILGALIHVLGTDPDRRTDGVDCTVADLDGEFSLRVALGAMLVTECIGYISDTTKIAPDMVIELKEDPTIFIKEVTAGPDYARAPTQIKTDSLIVVKGVVKDANGAPIVNAFVHIQGTKLNHLLEIKEAGDYPEQLGLYLTDRNAVSTDQEGKFTVRVTPETRLVTECMGYSSCTREAASDMVIELQDDHYDDKGIVIVR